MSETCATCATCRHWCGERVMFAAREHRSCRGGLPMLLPELRALPAKFETEFGLWRGAWLFTASDEGCAHHSPLDDRTATRVDIGAVTIE